MEALGLNGGASWRGRRVLVTGHTGFKGTWLALWLQRLGAEVSGLALAPEHEDGVFRATGPWPGLDGPAVDLRDANAVARRVADAAPEVVFHLGARALVRRSYVDPAGTFATNVQGTANLLAACAGTGGVQPPAAVIVVTSDKVYANSGDGRPFTEDDPLGGDDPYSASKACAELVVSAWHRVLGEAPCLVATARAGNVVGGGDWGEDRLVPDVLRAVSAGEPVRLRHPRAVRPWQHVLEPLWGYLLLAERLVAGAARGEIPRALNFGPPPESCCPVHELVDILLAELGAGSWVEDRAPRPPEHPALVLDASLAGAMLGWRSRLTLPEAVRLTVAWHRARQAGQDMRDVSLSQLAEYEERVHG